MPAYSDASRASDPRNRRGYRRTFWHCNVCDAQNHVDDGECQYCECEGKDCKRDSCSDPKHFAHEDEALADAQDGAS